MTRILERLADGETLTAILREPGMPARSTFYRRIEADADLMARYTQARELQMLHWADELIEIARDRSRDDGPGGNVAVARDRLQIDTMKFLMGKIAPRIFGDKPQFQIALQAASPQLDDARVAEIEEAARNSPAFQSAVIRISAMKTERADE